MNWSIWCFVGLALVLVELLGPSGFYLFLLGIAAVVVGVLAFIGVAASLTTQLLLFSVIAIVTWVCFARDLQRCIRGRKLVRADAVGQSVKLADVLAPGATGRGELWGSSWSVKNVGSDILERDAEVTVVRVEGLTLHVARR